MTPLLSLPKLFTALLLAANTHAFGVSQAESTGTIDICYDDQALLQGECGTFISECYQTCFALGQTRVSYACALQDGVYGAHSGCGSTDETDVVLLRAGIPVTVTTTLQSTEVDMATLTATSTASATSTLFETVQTSVCSYSTIARTMLVTTTITGSPTTLTSFTLTTATTTSTVTNVCFVGNTLVHLDG